MGNGVNKNSVRKPPHYHYNCRYDHEDSLCNKTAFYTRTDYIYVRIMNEIIDKIIIILNAFLEISSSNSIDKMDNSVKILLSIKFYISKINSTIRRRWNERTS